jgi:hypothetical protein
MYLIDMTVVSVFWFEAFYLWMWFQKQEWLMYSVFLQPPFGLLGWKHGHLEGGSNVFM